jgi:RHS repeat-associated protein
MTWPEIPGVSATYLYDGDGKRIQAVDSFAATNYLWDVSHALPQLAIERDSGGSLVRRYVYGAGRVSQTTASGTSFFFHSDSLGSVSALTSQTGAHQASYAYEPFGSVRSELRNAAAPPVSVMRFTGEQLDPTGLYHLRARQYDPSVGRFLSVDPVDRSPGMPFITEYGYADCRPTVFIDPSGEFRGKPSSAGEDAAGFASLTRPRSLAQWRGQAISREALVVRPFFS